MKKAFTLIELVIVIVILAILASIAIPKILVTRDDAKLTNAIRQVWAVRDGIESYKTSSMMNEQGEKYPSKLENDDSILFTNVTITGATQDSGWSKKSNTTYSFKLGGDEAIFIYQDGDFNCTSGCAMFGGKID